jgi:hypothetical protein
MFVPITIRYVHDDSGHVSNAERIYEGDFWRNYPAEVTFDEQEQTFTITVEG